MRLNIPVNGFTSFQLARPAFEDDVTVLLPNGETYLADAEELKLWMRRAGVHPDLIDKVTDLVWNFRRVEYSLPDQRVKPL